MAGGIRRVLPVDRVRAEQGMRELLRGLGFDVEEGVLSETPARVVEAFTTELLAGYDTECSDVIAQGSEPCEMGLDPVLLRDVAVATVCPHHFLVAEGLAMVGYEPGSRLLGLGTLVRLVQVASRRLAFQEEIASAVVQALMDVGKAQGAFCRIAMHHACLRDRGSRETGAVTVTARAAGSLADPARLGLVLGVPECQI